MVVASQNTMIEAKIASYREKLAKNDALLSSFGVRLDDLPLNLQNNLDELIKWKKEIGIIDVSVSTLCDIYLIKAQELLTKRIALNDLEMQYQNWQLTENKLNKQINDGRQFLKDAEVDLRNAVADLSDDQSSGETIPQILEHFKRVNVTLVEKKDKLKVNVKENLLTIVKKAKDYQQSVGQ